MQIRIYTSLKCILLLAILSSGILLIPFARGQSSAAATDTEQIQQLLKDYAACIDAADVTMADKIWSHSPEVLFIDPRGTHRGLKQVEDEFIGDTMGKTFSQRELLLENPKIYVYGDTAWSEMTWTFHATIRGGPAITTQGRETQFYRKENGAWHIVVIHYSGLPMTAKGKGF